MVKKSLLVLLWFPITLILIVVNLTLLVSTTRSTVSAQELPLVSVNRLTASAGTSQILGVSVISGDGRTMLLEKFLSKHQSPMSSHAGLIVEKSDEFNLDFRLIPAIAMCESNLGKRIPSHDSFNPFGIAVFTGQISGKKFESWEHAISWVAQYLKTNYYDRNIRELNAIGAIWAPPSVENGNSWANCVQSFMTQIS